MEPTKPKVVETKSTTTVAEDATPTKEKESNMIEVIPAGSSAVVTERHHDRDDNGYADIVKTIKDAEAQLDRAAGSRYADTVKTVKDSEAQLDRSAGDRFMQTVQDIKDAEARLERSSGDKFIQTVQDIKDAEYRGEKSAGDRFIKTVEDIKDAEYRGERSRSQTRDLVAAGFKENVVENLKQFEAVRDKFAHVDERMLLEFKDAQATAWKIHGDTERVLDRNLLQNMLAFKEQALLSEKLAAQASRELAECCCEIREAIGADGQKTRDLINSQEVDRLRDRALKAESGLAAYFAAKVAPVIPVL